MNEEDEMILSEFKQMLERNRLEFQSWNLRVRPTSGRTGKKPKRMTVGELFITKAFKRSSVIDPATLGEHFLHMLRDYNADELEAAFKRIIDAKRAFEQPEHINHQAFEAYRAFKQQTCRDPKKRELKRFIISRPETYKGFPPPDDKTGWTRIWEACGLSHLEN